MNKYLLSIAFIVFSGCSSHQYPIKPAPDPKPPEGAYRGSGSMVHGWELTEKFSLIYPRRHLYYGYEGWSVMRYTIETDGTTSDIEILDSSPKGTKYSFDNISIINIEKLKYRPVNASTTPKRTLGIVKVLTYEISKE